MSWSLHITHITQLTPKYWPSTKSWGTSSLSWLPPFDLDSPRFPALVLWTEEATEEEPVLIPLVALIRSLNSSWCLLHMNMSRSSTRINIVRNICLTFWHLAKWSRTTPNVVTYITTFPFSVSAKLWKIDWKNLVSLNVYWYHSIYIYIYYTDIKYFYCVIKQTATSNSK